VPQSWLVPWETIGRYESGFNQLAVNDSPAGIAAGTPEGLMQTVMGTYMRYHQPGTALNIFDPVSNIAAAIRYIVATYGNPDDTPGLIALAHGKPYSYYDSGGPLPAGMTVAVNKTGQTEEVLTPAERAAWVALVKQMLSQQGSAGAAGERPPININYYGTQQPTQEQMAIIMRQLSLAIGG
jgi:SLT domain-containing protein